tara:strand:- start:107 stop:670 length:564 start_codon:yes stop_codon:yes gene_type:complete
MAKSAEDEIEEWKEPEFPMDYLIRTQENTITQTKYLFYKLYDVSDKGWSDEQKEEWGHHVNEDGFRKSELFDKVPAEHRYVVAIPETGEWKSFRTRSEVTQDRTGGAMYPYAQWSVHETARMKSYGAIKLMSLACSKVLPENAEDGVPLLQPKDIERAALMLLDLEAERRELMTLVYDDYGGEFNDY